MDSNEVKALLIAKMNEAKSDEIEQRIKLADPSP